MNFKIVSTFLKSFSWSITLYFFFCFSAIGQEVINLPIEWKAPVTLNHEGKTTIAPVISDQELDNGKPVFFWQQKLKSTNFELKLIDYTTSVAPKTDISFLNEFSFQVTDSLQLESKVTSAASEHFAVLYLFPYVKVGEVIHRITNLELSLLPITISSSSFEKDFVANSVLQEGSGSWYKIQVKNDGIYKIDKSFLESCGISTNGLNPQHIHIYGNGDGKLPEVNSIPRTDDLAKNALFVVGESDGTFDSDDYILFYGWGPNRWGANGTTEFNQTKNIYSEYSCYFINISASEPPMRIQSVGDSDYPVTNVVTDYSFFDVYENDFVNLVKAGQRWYGELFDTELEKVFNFSVPNIVSSFPVTFKTAIATNSKTS
ncbi:MAG: hypothetical protein RL679_79, partial [Bacteroidota bacterium]